MVLPAKEGTQFTGEKLAELTDELLLFLRKLRTITITDETAGTKAVYTRTDDPETVTLTAQLFELNSDVPKTLSIRKFKYVSHTYSTTNIKEDKRRDVEEAMVVLAFPITSVGAASADITQSLFAFLPVRDYGFRFLVQGDFLLSSSREDVHKHSPWNRLARNEVVRAFLNALLVFKTDSVLYRSFLEFVPRKGDVTDAFFAEAAEKIIEELKKTECILSASGAWRKPNEVISADEEFKALFPNDDLKRILGLEYLSSEVRAPQATLDRLGVANATVQNHLLALIEKDDLFNERTTHWLKALYRYCDKKSTSEPLINKFKAIPMIKVDDGSFVKLKDTKVYFPLQRGRRYGFEHELPLLHPELVVGEGSDAVTRFLGRVGVKKSEPYSLIVNHILPKHTGGGWKNSEMPALVGHVAYIKEHIAQYLKGAQQVGELQNDATTKLRTGLYLQTKKVEDGKTYFAQAPNLYLGNEYRPPILLERLLGKAADPVKFIADAYLATGPREAEDNDADERRRWRDFFHQIGVNQYPCVTTLSGSGTDYRAGPELTTLLISEDVKIRKRAIEILDRNWAYYSRYLQASSSSRRGVTISSSQFLQFLMSMKAPSKKKGEFKLAETYLDVDYVRAVFGASIVYLDAEVTNTEFLDAVKVTHRVDAGACIKRLDQLRVAKRVNNRDVKLIYRELERRFEREETLIRFAFDQTPRIYVLGRWLTMHEVVWESGGAFMDSQYPPLRMSYQEHQTFFCKYLSVQKQPRESALIQALTKLDQFGETHADRKNEALKVYKRLAKSFRDYRARDDKAEPEWMDSLRTEEVFLDHMDRLIDVSNDIYIGDEQRLAEAFKAHDQISLFDLDPWQLPQLYDLLIQCGMQRLSAVATYSLTAAESAALDVEVTQRIRQRSRDLMRVVYARAHGVFERANKQGLWKSLESLEVRTVTALEVEAEVSGYRVRVPTDTYQQGRTIYLQAGTRGKLDKIARELCFYLGAKSDELSESIYRVLIAANEEELEDFFEVKGVPDIPEDEMVSLLDAEQHSQRDDSESETVHEHPAEQTQDISEQSEHIASDEWADVLADESTTEETLQAINISNVVDPAKRPAGHSTSVSPPPASSVADHATQPPPGHSTGVSPQGANSVVDHAMQTSAGHSTGVAPLPGPPPGVNSQGTSSNPPAPRQRGQDHRSSGRLMSYAEPLSSSDRETTGNASNEERLSIAKAAVDFVLDSERKNGHDVVEMPFTNEGFDIRRDSEGREEYIEVKGLSGAWGAEGIVLTPAELRMAERQREHFWLYVVEYATDPSLRRLYPIQDPFGKTNQFRFDSGWKSAMSGTEVLDPAPGLCVSIESLGLGTIVRVTEAGLLRRLIIRLDSGEELSRIYDPTKMSLSKPE
jgi:hypothetical protein